MATVYFNKNEIGELTDADKERIRKAATRPIVPDEDCPEYTEEQLKMMLAAGRYIEKYRKRAAV